MSPWLAIVGLCCWALYDMWALQQQVEAERDAAILERDAAVAQLAEAQKHIGTFEKQAAAISQLVGNDPRLRPEADALVGTAGKLAQTIDGAPDRVSVPPDGG